MIPPPPPPPQTASSSNPQQISNGSQNSAQIQPQNFPFSNPNNTHMGNINNIPSPMFQSGFMNNSQFGHMGFAPQNMTPFNQMNPCSVLPLAQFLGQNFPNLVHQLNQSMGLVNGQFFQNMNQQHVPGQMLNMSHTSFGGPNQTIPMVFQNQPFGANQAFQPVNNQNAQNFIPPTMGGNGPIPLPDLAQQLQGNSNVPLNSNNQVFHPVNSQNPQNFIPLTMGGNGLRPLSGPAQQLQGNSNMAFNSNQVLHPVNQNPQNFIPQSMGGNGSRPLLGPAQQSQGNSTVPFNSVTQPQQVRNLQSPAFTGSQGKSSMDDGGNRPNSYSKNSAHRNFTQNSRKGFQKNQIHHKNNEKKKYGFPGGQKGKGFHSERRNNFGVTSSTNQVKNQKRSLSMRYTEREIQQWRDARRKNYPSSANIQKRFTATQTDCTLVDREKLLRQELADVLAKQAELGVEVAEIPSEYLSYSENREKRKRHDKRDSREEAENGSRDTEGPLTKREKPSRNRFNKTRKRDKRNRWKKEKLEKPREPTLLQKLLKADMERDKGQLLQALRFMVMNSFFKEWPDKPLIFPSVIVKEYRSEINVGDEASMSTRNFSSQGTNNAMVEKLGYDDENATSNGNHNDNSDDDDDDDNDNDVDELEGNGIQIPEEEGEIID